MEMDKIELFANICTITGFILAVCIFLTWRNQQNYSFTRDKIFEAEIIVKKIENSFKNYLEIKTNFLLGKNDPGFDSDYTKKRLSVMEENSVELLTEYSNVLSALEIINVKFDKEILIDEFALSANLGRHIRDINEAQDSVDSLIGVKELIFKSISNEFGTLLSHLYVLRKKI